MGSNAIFIGQRMGNNEGIASRMNMMDFRDIISINRLTNLNIVSSNNTQGLIPEIPLTSTLDLFFMLL